MGGAGTTPPPSLLEEELGSAARPTAPSLRGPGPRFCVGLRRRRGIPLCPECGSVKKKELSERIHSCECGCVLDRDVAAAKVILALGLDGAFGDGYGTGRPMRPEKPRS